MIFSFGDRASESTVNFCLYTRGAPEGESAYDYGSFDSPACLLHLCCIGASMQFHRPAFLAVFSTLCHAMNKTSTASPIPLRQLARGVFLLLPGLLALLPGCSKDEPHKTIIHGQVREYGTLKPIAGARIYVGCEDSEPFGPSSFGVVDTLVTDADGQFYKEYPDGELCTNSSLIPYKTGYYKTLPLYPTTDNKAFDVVLDPEAWFRLLTIPDLGKWEALGFGGTFSPHEAFALLGQEEQIFSHPGGRKIILHSIPLPYSGVTYTDSIYLAPHDTTPYTIHY